MQGYTFSVQTDIIIMLEILTGPIRLTRNKSLFIQLMRGYTFHIDFDILLAGFLINSLDTETDVMIECSKLPSFKSGF